MRGGNASLIDQLQTLQLSHTKLGQVKELRRSESRGGGRLSPKRASPMKQVSPKSQTGDKSKRSSPINQEMISGRPATAPTRGGENLLAAFDAFDATTARPWTAGAVATTEDTHMRLRDLVQLDGKVDDFAHQVVESTTLSQLKDSSKVFQGLLGRIPTAYTVNIKANMEKPTFCKAKPKPSRFKVKEKLTGGLVIVMDPRSNLEDNLVTVTVEHKVGRFGAYDRYRALGTGNTFNLELTSEVAATYEEEKAHIGQTRSYPGWNGRPPIWVPTTECKISISTQKLHSRMTRRLSAAGVQFKPKDVGKEFSLPKPPISANFLIFSAASPKAAILYMRHLQEKLWRGTVEDLTIGGGMPAINIAALHGNTGTVNELLVSGANANARRDPVTEYTPLHEAVMGGHAHVITNLLERGANQFLRDVRGNNALHVACLNDDIECIRALLADSNKMIIRRSLNAENAQRLKPHQVCSGAYCKHAVETVMKTYNLAVRKARIPLSMSG